MRTVGWGAIGVVTALGLGSGAGAQELPPLHAYDVVLDVPDAPPRSSRFVFGLVNGDVAQDNFARIEDLTTDGHLGTAVRTQGSVDGSVADGFILDDKPFYVTKWIQQDASVHERLSFRVTVSKVYPHGNDPKFQPDQFSFAVLESGSNNGYLKTDDPTTANTVFSIDLQPGSEPRLYAPAGGGGPGAPAPWRVAVTEVPVPEPGAIAQTLAGAAVLAALRRRKR